MSGSRRSGSQRSLQRASTIFAIIIAAALVLSGLIVLLPLGSDGGEPDVQNRPPIEVTPGAEVERWETEVAENPDDANRIVVLAEVLANSGRIQESIVWFERAVELRPEDAQLRVAFGRALQRNGSLYDAELQLLRAIELDPEDAPAAFYLASLYEESPQARIDEARIWYQRAIDVDPESIVAGQARQRLDELDGVSATPSPSS